MKRLMKILLWPFDGDVLALIFCGSIAIMLALIFAVPYVPEWAESILVYAAILMIIIAFGVSIIKWLIGPLEWFDD